MFYPSSNNNYKLRIMINENVTGPSQIYIYTLLWSSFAAATHTYIELLPLKYETFHFKPEARKRDLKIKKNEAQSFSNLSL